MSNPEPRQLMKTICFTEEPNLPRCNPGAGGPKWNPFLEDPVFREKFGRPVPAPNFFPNDFKPLANACHAAGVKFGIHMMRGIPRAAVEANTPIEGGSVRARDIADPVLFGPALEGVEWKTADDQFLPVNPKKQP
jgi:hypothetical protein